MLNPRLTCVIVGAILVRSAWSCGPPSLAAVPESSSVPAEAVRYLGTLYFNVEVPGIRSSDPSLPSGIACRVQSGPALHVFFVAPEESRWGRRSYADADRIELNRLQEAMNEAGRAHHAQREQVDYLRRLAQDEELPESFRSRLPERIRHAEEQAELLQKRAAEARDAMTAYWSQYSTSRPSTSGPSKSGKALLVGRLRTADRFELVLPSVVTRRTGETLTVTVPETVPVVESPPEWLKRWADARLADLRVSGDDRDYVAFMSSRLQERFNTRAVSSRPWFGPRPEGAQLYDLFTGSAAIRESIQLDREIQTVLGEQADVALQAIPSLELEDHPFEVMRNGRPFTGSTLAKLCPSDALFLRVRSLTEWFRIKDLTDRWGGSFLSTVQIHGRDRDTFGRYMRQLALGDELMGRLVGTRVVGELAVVATDPLFMEGTGLAVVFSPREGQDDLFHQMFDTQRKAKTSALRDATRDTLKLAGVEVDRLVTTDGRVRSYACVLAGNRVFCNSPALLERVIRATAHQRESLFSAPDYQYYRALYPMDATESGFVYLSQDWFRRITGPAWRIARGRRRVAAQVMNNVRFTWQSALTDGTAAPDLGSMEATGVVSRDIARYLGLALDPTGGAVSSESYGPLAMLRPVDENLPTQVSALEQQRYTQFREEYTRYWRQYIDPVGIQFRVTDEELTADTLILPLIDNSIYSGLKELCGGTVDRPGRAPPLPAEALGAVTLHWSPESTTLDGLLGELLSGGYGSRAQFNPAWFGETLTVGAADGDLLFTVAAGTNELLTSFIGRRGGQAEALGVAVLLSSLTLPTFAVVEVRDAIAVENYLSGLWVELERRRGGGDFRVLGYQTADKPRIHTVTFTLVLVDLRLHYTFVDGWMLIATKPHLLAGLIEAAGRDPGDPFGDHGRLVVRPQAFRKAASAIGIAWQERIAKACRGNLASLQRAADGGRFDRAEQFLGYRVVCPEGGAYSTRTGQVRCSLHGTRELRMQPLLPPRNAPAVRLVNDMKEVSVAFRFTEDGLRSRLRVQLRPRGEDRPE